MVYECLDKRGTIHMHRQSEELSSKEAMQRLGVFGRPFKVTRWPEGRPDLAHCVQQFEVHERTDRHEP